MSQCPKGEDISTQTTLRPQRFKECKYIQSCEMVSISPTGPESQAIGKCILGISCKTQDSRCVYKVLSGMFQEALVRWRDSIKMVSLACVS